MSPAVGSRFAAGGLLILAPMEHQSGSQKHPGGGNGCDSFTGSPSLRIEPCGAAL